MKRILVFLLFFNYLCTGQSITIPQDKLLHAGGCYAISATTSSIIYNITEDRKKAFIYGVLSSVIIGGVKELHDINHGDSNWGDMGANVVGGVLGSFTVVVRF
jgi:hypothetical protein|tara:strand:- start:684 stop:992 length:309 start_codon:yes stop_codon:yes gene_type:complete